MNRERKKNWGPGGYVKTDTAKSYCRERKLHNSLMEKRHLKMESYMRKKGSFSCDTIFMVHQSALKLRKKSNLKNYQKCLKWHESRDVSLQLHTKNRIRFSFSFSNSTNQMSRCSIERGLEEEGNEVVWVDLFVLIFVTTSRMEKNKFICVSRSPMVQHCILIARCTAQC